MEYVERGSLEERLRNDGPLPVEQAVSLFRDVAVGLVHAHDKGVLHCDLKPANILLDHEGRPRIADFGQSRLSHEQQPALGTLFYMAPEQADLKAVPDARWDVYALGALFYTMITGAPPHRNAKDATEAITELEQARGLEERLERYRQLIVSAPPPAEHRRVPGMDRGLAEIIDRCLAADPQRRFANVQSVLHALGERARRRARRPLVALGALGPTALLAIVALMSFRWFSLSLDQSSRALTDRAVEGLGFAADSVATVAANEIERRFEAVEKVAADPEVVRLLQEVRSNPDIRDTLEYLSNPAIESGALTPDEEKELARQRGLIQRPKPSADPPQRPVPDAEIRAEPNSDPRFPEIIALENRILELIDRHYPDQSAYRSWFVTDVLGVQLMRTPESSTTGSNYSWRTYFHGGIADHAETWRPAPDQHVRRTQLSAAYESQSTDDWSVAVSTPVHTSGENQEFAGVVGISFLIGRAYFDLAETDDRFAVLADMRPGGHEGLIVQHPLYYKVARDERDRLEQYRLAPAEAYPKVKQTENYRDPMSGDPAGAPFARRWLAAQRPVVVRGEETGWVVVVQEAYDHAIGRSLNDLRRSFISTGLITLASIAVVIGLLWAFVVRSLSITRPRAASFRKGFPTPNSPRADSA
jgi:hypothetical protein